MIHLLFGAIAALIGYAIGSSKQTVVTVTKTGGEPPRALPIPRPKPTSHVDRLNHCVASGLPVDRNLVRYALIESHRNGDMKNFQAIATLFRKPDPSKESEENSEGEKESEGVKSPIEGVTDEDWQSFVSKLRVREPSYSTNTHLGSFEHNRSRLRSLGFDGSLETEPEQYEALVSDLTDHYENAKPLIDEFCGDAVNLDGNDVPITMSGVLALLKAGGMQGAEQWLRDPQARANYPRTKELFLRANGCF